MQARGPASDSASAPADTSAPANGAQPAPLEILLVEDNPADVRMMQEAVRVAGIACRLHTVEDGLQAISFLCQTRQFSTAPKPHIVLLDLNVPKLNGHEVLGEIRSNDSLRDIPVVVLTSSRSVSDRQKSEHMKADHFMTKAAGLAACVEQIKTIAALAKV